MSKLFGKRSIKAGLPPGTLMHVGAEKVEKVKITVLDYDEQHFEDKETESIDDCAPFRDKPTVTWINIDGIHQMDIIEKMGSCFGVHPLVLEDIVHTGQRPKIEDFGNYIYVVLKMLYRGNDEGEIEAEQVSMILSESFVITFQEKEGDVFDPIRQRIKQNKGRIRKMGADYLAYSLIDAIVDNYFVVLEKFGEHIESLEEELLTEPASRTLPEIHDLKRGALFLRKSVWPLREVISGLERGESSLFKKSTLIYLRDIYDHTIQIIDTIETSRDLLSGMLDTYLSITSNRMNEVMKVLTIIATIFIPLTFIAGIYGMNFKYMPELESRWAYPGVLLVMLAVGIVMLFYFRRKKWL